MTEKNMAIGDMVYEVECLYCGRKYRLPDLASNVPQHPQKGERVVAGVPYVPCVGSGMMGRPIRPVIEGSE